MRPQSLSRKIILAYSLLVTLAAGLLTSSLYWQFHTAQRQEIRNRLLELLQLSAPQIDGDYLALTTTADSMKLPFYTINQKRLQNIQAAVPSIAHIYVVHQQPDGQLVFLLDYARTTRFIAPVGTPLQHLPPRLKAGIAALKQPIVEPDLLRNADGMPVLYGYSPITNRFGRTSGVLVIELSVSSLIQNELQAGAIAAGVFCLVLLVTLVVIWWLSQSLVIRPILRLNQASKQIASGQWEQLLPSDRNDELGDLATSFNQMAQQLRESFVTLEQRVQERTDQLQLALSAAKMGTWEWDMITNRQYWSAENYGLWGLCTDPSGRVLDQAGVEVSAFPTFELLLKWIHPDDRDRLLQTIQQTSTQHQRYEIEHRVCWEDGSIHWRYSRGAYVFNEQGQPIKLVGISMDITDRKQAELEIRHNRDLFEAIFQESTDAILLTAPTSGQIWDCNQRAIELFEAETKVELLGTVAHTLRKNPTSKEGAEILTFLRGSKVWRQECEYRTRKKHTFWGSVALKGIQVADQRMILARITDISDRKQAEIALMQSDARLKLALGAFPTVVWEVDLATDRIFFTNSRTGQLVSDEMPRLEHRAKMVYPDDREAVDACYQRALADRGSFQVEHRLRSDVLPEGWHWVQVNGTVQVDEAGTPTRVVGISFDIHARKQAERRQQQQAEADQLLATIAQTINQSVRLDQVLETCLEKIRRYLRSDRVLICRFDADYNVVIEREALSCPALSLLNQIIEDPCFDRGWADRYQQGYITVCSNAQAPDITPCYAALLAQMRVQASFVVGIMQSDQIWGLMIVHFCDAPHDWQQFELDLLKQLGLQIGTANQKASLYKQLENQLLQKEVLLKEVNHRVKNNLQMISAMLWLQSEAANNPIVSGALFNTRNRLQAMSLTHEILYQSSDLGQINFHDYIQRLATNILIACSTSPDQIKLIFHLQPVTLNLETAISCGLLLNELITNAIKHGFPNQRCGEIYVMLEQTLQPEPTTRLSAKLPTAALSGHSPHAPSRYILTVQDNGVGIPKALNLYKLHSLGLKIVYDLARQLDGSIEHEHTHGTLFRLIFPVVELR